MKIAVFGCNGYIGRHLVNYLSSQKIYKITCFDIHENFYGLEIVNYEKLDITKMDEVSKCQFYDYIYFFCGLTGTKESLKNYFDFIKINEIGLINILEHYKDDIYKPKIIFPSTRLIYKGVTGKLLCEESEKEFKTIYALNKWND